MRLAEMMALRQVIGAGALVTVTERCPLSCAHCASAATLAGRQLDATALLRFLSTFTAKCRPEVLMLTGGEPLTRPRLVVEAARLVRSAGTRTAVLSGAFFAQGKGIPPSIREVARAVDHFSLSLDVFHEREVARENVFGALHDLLRSGVATSLHVVGTGPDDPYLAEVSEEVVARFWRGRTDVGQRAAPHRPRGRLGAPARAAGSHAGGALRDGGLAGDHDRRTGDRLLQPGGGGWSYPPRSSEPGPNRHRDLAGCPGESQKPADAADGPDGWATAHRQPYGRTSRRLLHNPTGSATRRPRRNGWPRPTAQPANCWRRPRSAVDWPVDRRLCCAGTEADDIPTWSAARRQRMNDLRAVLELVTPAIQRSSAALWQPMGLRERYSRYLAEMHAVLRASVPLMVMAGAQTTNPVLRDYFAEHVEEELGHDDWLLDDVAAVGLDPDAVRASPPSALAARLVGPRSITGSSTTTLSRCSAIWPY
ncbi:radical SAM protein [Fodinicola feengrottensis]|uniref:radical SAM protein n=1 Tax=Fodinicola feengrottensis TaxID=435914 RepID=UPI00244231DE|nr:radical SAM protein [Fodinicola feengrottensis]